MEDLRRWIISNGFKIIHESMIHEGHYYTIVVLEKGEDIYSEEDYIFGKYFNSQAFIDYWQFRKDRILNILPQLNDEIQIEKFNKLLLMIDNKIKK